MARTLQFKIEGQEISASIGKIDRKKLYGWVDKSPVDRHGNPCFMGSISEDGMHLFGKESFEQGFVSGDGAWYPKSEIVYVDSQNQPVPQIEASFNQLIDLKNTITIDDYLLHEETVWK